MAILLNNNGYQNGPWVQALAEHLPGMPIHQFPDIPVPADIHYAVVWNHPHGDLLNYPNLRAILVLGAGMDQIDNDPGLPDVPVVRLVDPAVGDDMAQYALYWIIHFQRRFEDYRKQALDRKWQRFEVPLSKEVRVSVLGLGPIGAFVAQRIALNGFATRGWSRSTRQLDNVECFTAAEGLEHMLATSDVLVNCLPLNQDTRHFLNRETMRMLPRGAFLINLSRGAVIDDQALMQLLDEKHIGAAALDTFVQEPLPADSRYWQYENVFITPHAAGGTYPRSAAKVIADNILRVEKGQQPFPIHYRAE